MYEQYFGLKTRPFSIVPDPRNFYMSSGHSEALAHLLYGIQSDGAFVMLTGEVGTGKTTVCRRLLELMPGDCEVAFILNPRMTAEELLATICDEFRISYPEGTTSIKVFVSRINDYLLDVHQKGRRAVLIIEEAQNLMPEVLEQVRLLTNLETNEHKLLQIVMLGQPELRDMLSQHQLRQLSQRITARYHLGSLPASEVAGYVNHRLSVAGLAHGQLFPPVVLKKLFRLSGGVPRLINVICDRALLGAFVQGKDRVDLKTLTTAAREVAGEKGHSRRGFIYQGMVGAFLVVFCAALGTLYFTRGPRLISKAAVDTVAQGPAADAEKETVKPRALGLPGNYTGPGTREAAYAALFKKWLVEYSQADGADVCEQAGRQGLQCVNGRGSISDLREMNRPVVLTLMDEKGGEYYGTLTSLGSGSATLVIGNEARIVDIEEIVENWSGTFLLLWRIPPEYKGRLKPGSRGPTVAWLERQLAMVQGRAVPHPPRQLYDSEVMKHVKKFQLATGLIPDGVAGPQTILRLCAATDNGEPTLSDRKGGY